jgi:hypothetical protein
VSHGARRRRLPDRNLRTVIDGRKLTPEELDAASHWADEDDIRARDQAYEAFRNEELQQALADLEALEVGYMSEEVELGDHRGYHVPPLGCLLSILLIGALIYGAFGWGGT